MAFCKKSFMIFTTRKVIFSEACVSHFVDGGRGSLYDVTSCLAAWSYVHSRGLCMGFLCLGGVSVQGVSLEGGYLCERGKIPHANDI